MALTKLPGFTLDSTSSFTFANASVTANVTAGNVKTDNLLYANGVAWTFGSTYSNSNVASYLPTYTGNISAGNILTDHLLYANGVAWSFGSTYSNSNVASYLPTYTGNVSANYFIGNGSTLTHITGGNVDGQVGNALIAGTVYTAAQPNITSVGTLTTVSVTGNVSSGGNIIGNGQYLTAIAGGNVTGQVANSLVAGTVYTAAQPNITSVGTLTTVSVTGNVSSGGNIIGNGQYLTAIAGGNVTGQVANALVAGTVYTAAQPNITSVGTLSSVTITANASAGNIKTDNLLYANGVAWNLSGSYSNTNVAAYLPTYTGNYAGNNVTLTGNISTGSGSGNISGANYISANYFTGTLTTAAQPNVTSVGTLASLSVTGNVTSAYFIGNGSQLTGLPASYSNTNVAAYLPTYTGNFTAGNISTTGNITAAYFIGNGSQLTGLPASYSNTNVAAYLPTYTGNFTAGNANISGTITTGSGSGNISGANYVIANFFQGNGSGLSSITGANVTGYVPLSTAANTAATVTTAAQPNITSLGTLVDANISGNLVIAGNLTVSGSTEYTNVTNLYVKDPIIEMGGGANGGALTTNDGKDRGTLLHYYTTGVVDAFMGWDNSNGEFAFGSNVSTSSEVVTFNTFGNVRAGNFIGALSGAATTAGTVTTAAQPNITSVGTLTTVSVSGNVSSGGNIIGNGQYLTSITGANVTGTVSSATTSTSATTAATVTTAAQPNITSVGTLASLTVSGLLTATGGGVKTSNIIDSTGTNTISVSSTTVGVIGNLTVGTGGTGNATATYFIGNGSALTSLTGGNVTGQVGNALVAGTVYTAAQPNITSVGTLASLSVTANITSGNATLGNLATANYFSGNGSLLTSLTGGNVTGQVGNALVSGTVYTAAQPNITSVGTLASLSVTANITAGNINGGNAIVGNYFVGDGSLLTGLPASYSNTNVQNYLPTYTGNLSPGNLTVSTRANLGAVGNIYIGGGTADYVLKTDGAGNLSWTAQSGGSGTAINVDNFTGDGSTTAFTLSSSPSGINNVIVNYNGAFVGRGSYSVSGTTLTFGSAPASGSSIEVSVISGLGTGSATFNTRTATGDGSTTGYTVTAGSTVSTVLVTLDGVLQTPTTDYTISSTTLTFGTAPYNGAAIQIRELGVAVATSSGSALLIQDEGSNLTATANTINFVGSSVTATNVGNVVTVTVSGTSNTSIRAQAMTMGIIFGG